MPQITHFCGVKFLVWKSGTVKFWTNIMSASEKAVFCNININDFDRTFLALFISIFIWICLLAKDQTCQLWIIQLNFSPLFNLKQSRSLLCLLQLMPLSKLTYDDKTCVRGCEAQSYNYLQAERRKKYNHLPFHTFRSWSCVFEVGRYRKARTRWWRRRGREGCHLLAGMWLLFYLLPPLPYCADKELSYKSSPCLGWPQDFCQDYNYCCTIGWAGCGKRDSQLNWWSV